MTTNSAFWDKIADKYDRDSQNKGKNYVARLQRASAVFPADAKVLDVGCASGEITLDLAAQCKHITGIDLSDKLIDLARAKAQQRGITNIRFERMDGMDPSLTPGSFDAITIYSVFHLVPDVPTIVQRMHTLLKPGGVLITETPMLGDWSMLWAPVISIVKLLGKAPPIVHRLKRTNIETLLCDTGFEILDSNVYNPKSGQHCITARRK